MEGSVQRHDLAAPATASIAEEGGGCVGPSQSGGGEQGKVCRITVFLGSIHCSEF
jgi:hypothetical protein